MKSSKVALITGGAGELAQTTAHLLRQDGWEVHAPGREALDVTDKASVKSYFQQLERLDLLIHAAGNTRDRLSTQMTEEDFSSVLQPHLKGAFLCIQSSLPLMMKREQGHCLLIGSFSALSGPIGQTNYAAAKAGLIGLMQSTAAEYGQRGIRANLIMPGFLETGMTRHLLEKESTRKAILSTHALGKLNTVEDAARFMLFLDSMKQVSGQVFQLDSRIHSWTS